MDFSCISSAESRYFSADLNALLDRGSVHFSADLGIFLGRVPVHFSAGSQCILSRDSVHISAESQYISQQSLSTFPSVFSRVENRLAIGMHKFHRAVSCFVWHWSLFKAHQFACANTMLLDHALLDKVLEHER